MCFESSDFLWVDLKFCWLRSSITVSPRPADLYHQVLLSRLRCQIHTLFWAHRTLILDTILLCPHLAPKSFYVHTSNTYSNSFGCSAKASTQTWVIGVIKRATHSRSIHRHEWSIIKLSKMRWQWACWNFSLHFGRIRSTRNLQNRTGEPCRTGTGVCKPIPSISDSSLRVIRRWW